MNNTNLSKATVFRDLHSRDSGFVIPNPWDIGSAKILEGLGFEALATSSAGFAWSRGCNDGSTTLEETLEHCRDLCAATDVPITADLGIGFGESLDELRSSISLAIETGLAGCSLEDASVRNRELFEFDRAVERVAIAKEVCRELNPRFVLTARCERYAYGENDFDDTVRRLKAYEEVGADVLYAPGMVDLGEIELLLSTLQKPVNVLTGFTGMSLSSGELCNAGVKRVSVGLQLAKIAYGTLIEAARELRDTGKVVEAETVIRSSEIGKYMY